MKDRTTLQLRREVLDALKKKKIYPRETYDDVLRRELKLDIKQEIKKVKGGY